jgi:hypothetical protein
MSTDEKPLALVRHETALAEPSVGQMMQDFIARGVTADNVAAFERLVALKERLDDKQAEREFALAFISLQKEMPEVHATKSVPDKQGNVKFRFAPYEEIMSAVKPMLEKHGFTVTFSMDFKEGRVIQTCTLMHVGGHSRSNQFMARIGSGPPGASECQADGAASTYAKRFALCNALNITVESDTDGQDARNEGAPITFDQVAYLKELVRDTKSDEAAFLRFAGASKYEEIGSARYDSLVAALHKKIHK